MMVLAVFLGHAATVYGAEKDDDEDKTLAPYFLVEGGDDTVDSFPLKGTKVSTDINGVIAETYVTQIYTNEGEKPISASYVFPASADVTVHGMKMQIGDQVVTARIKEREEAKEEFEEAKRDGKSASLLEQQRPNVFSMDVANIMPGDEVRIELHYTEMVTSSEGVYQFVFPTVVGPRFASPPEDGGKDDDEWLATPYLKEGSTPPGDYDIEVSLSMGVPIRELKCRSHEIVNSAREGDTTAKIKLADTETYAGDRDFILEYKLTGEQVDCGLVLNSDEEENCFMLMVQPPERVQPENIPPREYIFVLDVSGSMIGYPLDTAKEMIRNLVSGLKETDCFNVILFSEDSLRLSKKSVPATKGNIKKAIAFIDKQEGGGGTRLAPAVKSAIAVPADHDIARSIVVVTDGYISGETEIFDIINENIGNTSFFAFGIGSSVNRYLIDGIAKTGLGESFVVTDPSEAEAAAKRFLTYIEAPVLTDVHITYDGFEAYDTEPAMVPVLFAQRPIVVFGKWRGEPKGTIRVTGKAGGRDYSEEIPVSEAEVMEGKAISYLWARRMVEKLTDYGFNAEEDPDIKKEVTEIGLKYSMMTPYTSFIAVIETVRNEKGESTDVDQPLPLPSGVSENAIGGVSVSGGGYMTGSEPGETALLLILAFVMSIPVLRSFKRRRQ